FFFSSRRRHTRFSRDWSSDVCSSDLIASFLTTIGTLDREGIAALIGVFVEPDPGTPERYVPFAVQAGLSLPDESYYRQDSFAEKIGRASWRRTVSLKEGSVSANKTIA